MSWFRSARTPVPRSPEWRKVRKQHLKNHPTCEACGTRILNDVHHVIPFHVDPSLELAAWNLITLCRRPLRRHHFRVGHRGNWSSSNPDVRAEAAALLAGG